MANLNSTDVKNKIDIVQYIKQHVDLEKHGNVWQGLCPFHADTVPSFTVYPDSQTWKCFGCNEGGDVIAFVMKFHGVLFGVAMKMLSGDGEPVSAQGVNGKSALLTAPTSLATSPEGNGGKTPVGAIATIPAPAAKPVAPTPKSVTIVTDINEPPPLIQLGDLPANLDLGWYGRIHGVTEQWLTDQGWSNTTGHYEKDTGWVDTPGKGDPAIMIPSSDGNPRIRLLKQKAYFRKTPGQGEICWYAYPGTRDDRKTGFPELPAEYIILCNGQISSEAGRFNELQAFCVTDGEKALPAKLLAQIKDLLATSPATTCIIALDADDAGRKATEAIARQLTGHKILTVDFGGAPGYDLADFCLDNARLPSAQFLARLLALAQSPPDIITEGSTVNTGIIRGLNAPTVLPLGQIGSYLPIPWKSLHAFGGFCKVLHPGKIAVLMAPAGHGKTSLLETWVDAWLRAGFDMFWWGNEWTPDEYGIRRIQRYGGMSIEQYADDQIWRDEMKRSGRALFGEQLPADVRARSIKAINTINGWRGKIHYLPPAPNTETTQTQIKERLHSLRRQGRRVGGIVWDYLTLLKSADGDSAGNVAETVLGSISDFAIATQTVNIVGSQINKPQTRLIESDFRLTAADMHWAREDKVKLLLGIEPVYEDSDEPDADGIIHKVFKRARLRILKNNIGRTWVKGRSHVWIDSNFEYLSWIESAKAGEFKQIVY